MNILKRYAKGFSISVLATASFCMGVPAALAQGQPAPAAAASSVSVPENLLSVVKLPPLATLAEKVVLVSQKAELDAQTQMLMLIILGQYGFPSFPDVSPSEGVTLFVLSGDEAGAPTALSQFVVFAKVAADSPMRGVLESQNLQVQDREGWTLIAIDPTAFSTIKDFSSLAAIASSKGHFDIEGRTYFSQAIRDSILGIAESNVEAQEGQSPEALEAAKKANSWLKFAVEVLNEGEWVGYGLSVNAENVTFGGAIAPKAGTASAALINTPIAAGKVKAGEFFSADAAIGYVGRYDKAAGVAYLNSLLAIAKRMPDQQASALMQDALTQYAVFVSAADGGSAGIVNDFNPTSSQVRTQSIQTGTFSITQLDELYSHIFKKLVPDFIALIATDNAAEILESFKVEVKTDVDTVNGQSISAVSYSIPNPEDEAESVAQNTYYTVINGASLSADNLDSLKALATVYAAGKPVANNLADAYPLSANAWGKGGIDIKKLVKSTTEALNATGEANDLGWLAQLDALDIKPALFDFKAEGGHAVYSINLSLDSVVTLVKFYLANQGGDEEEVEIIEVQVAPAN